MKYEELKLKIPVESASYNAESRAAVKQITDIFTERLKIGSNKIIVSTNLKQGLPLENINKIAGPLIEAWAGEILVDAMVSGNRYCLENVEIQHRLDMADIVLQFKKQNTVTVANVDVKATSNGIKGSGKSPNITSFSRIRTAYVVDPDYMFIILSLRYSVYSDRDSGTDLSRGIIEITDVNAYDLKFISASDISYNPALGTGQVQIKDIHHVSEQYRTTWEMCQLLDKKYLMSSRRTIEDFIREAGRNGWLQ